MTGHYLPDYRPEGEPLDQDARQAGQPWQQHTVSETVLLRLIDHLIDRNERLDTEVLKNQESILQELKNMTVQVDNLRAAIAKTTEVGASAIVLIKGISARLKEIKNDPVEIQTFADELSAGNTNLAAAVTENTDADPNA